jgi:hypothetical protein
LGPDPIEEHLVEATRLLATPRDEYWDVEQRAIAHAVLAVALVLARVEQLAEHGARARSWWRRLARVLLTGVLGGVVAAGVALGVLVLGLWLTEMVLF